MKDLDQDLHARTTKRISQDRHKRTCCCWSGSYKILMQEPPKSLPQELFVQAPLRYGICEIFMQGPRREDLTRISTRSSVKDIYTIMHGPLREEFIRISTRSSHKDMHKITQGPLRCQQDLGRTCTRSCTHPRHDFIRICTTSSHKDRYKTLVKIFVYYAPRNPCKSVIEGHSRERRRSPYQDPRESAKISTVAQGEPSGTDKVTRRLRERYQDADCATTRTIRQAQSHERIARAISKFAPRHNESNQARTRSRDGCASQC